MDRFDWERRLRSSGEPAMVKFAGLTLATYYPVIRPGTERLAQNMGVCHRTAKTALAALRRNGWLTLAVPASGAGRGRADGATAATWMLSFPKNMGNQVTPLLAGAA